MFLGMFGKISMPGMSDKTDILVIRSARGAAGALLLLQSYGLFLFYMLVGSAESLRCNFTLFNLDAIIDLLVILCLLPVLISVQSEMLAELRKTADLDELLRRPSTRGEKVRAMAVFPLAALYAVLFFRPGWAGLPEPGLAWTVFYQLFSVLATFALERHFTLNAENAGAAGPAGGNIYSRKLPKERKATVFGCLFAGAFGAAVSGAAMVVMASPGGAAGPTRLFPLRALLVMSSVFLLFGLTALLTDDFGD